MKNLFLASSLLFSILSFAQIADSSKRNIKLEGAFNFRDIGGYETKSGKHIKWGKIYRSAEISKLTSEDMAKIKNLSISRDFDFRGPYEVQKAPDKIPSNIMRISLPAGSEDIGKDQYSMMKMMASATNGDSMMLTFYENIKPFRDRYKPISDQLILQPNDSAILYHCSAGKDRTGIFTALLLSTLGVDSTTIFDDYLASNFYSANKNDGVKKMLIETMKVKEQVVDDLLGVKAAYLQATFTEIKKQYGSVEAYLKKVMGVKIKKLKSIYLEQK